MGTIASHWADSPGNQAQKSRIVLGRLEEIAVGLGSIGWMDTCYVLFGSVSHK